MSELPPYAIVEIVQYVAVCVALVGCMWALAWAYRR